MRRRFEKESINIMAEAQGRYSSQVLEQLLYRRQFILAPTVIAWPASWQKLCINRTAHLWAHPDLEVCQVRSAEKSVTLLGYILDPHNVLATNEDIIHRLITGMDRGEELYPRTSELGGRWILIVDDGRETILLNDACGLRQIYYARTSRSEGVWCASQPGLLAEALNLEVDKEALEFMNSREVSDNYDEFVAYWWPGDTSLYEDVRLLLPNHSLTLPTGEVVRYWPDTYLDEIDLSDAVLRCSQLLSGLMKSAQQRYKLALSLSAGWDSRVMLALSREIVNDSYCFTLSYPFFSKNTQDVLIPQSLSRKLKFDYRVIMYPDQLESRFKEISRKNCPSPNKAYCADVQALYEHYPQDRVCITGDVAEVAKNHFRIHGDQGGRASAQDLAGLVKMGSHPFCIRAFEDWLSTLESYNVHELDLFCWEQMAGRWQALNQAEHDIVHEFFSPYNCRSLLVTMLSVDEKYRQPPLNILQKELISSLWEDVLCEPINPPEAMGAKDAFVTVLKQLRIHHLVPEQVKRAARRVFN